MGNNHEQVAETLHYNQWDRDSWQQTIPFTSGWLHHVWNCRNKIVHKFFKTFSSTTHS